MDFLTATAPPIPITIDGKPYSVPRFLLPDAARWAADRQKQIRDGATAHLDKDEKARFLNFYQVPDVDIFDIAQYARSPAGTQDILKRQLKLAGVDDSTTQALLANTDPIKLRNLSEQICAAAQAAEEAKGMSESSADPLAAPPGESGGSPGTGQTSSESSQPTTVSTQTA